MNDKNDIFCLQMKDQTYLEELFCSGAACHDIHLLEVDIQTQMLDDGIGSPRRGREVFVVKIHFCFFSQIFRTQLQSFNDFWESSNLWFYIGNFLSEREKIKWENKNVF